MSKDYTEMLTDAVKRAIRTAHGSRAYAKALRKVERELLDALGYATYAEFVKWEGDGK